MRVAARCDRARQSRRPILQQTKAAGSGDAPKFSSSDTVRSDDGSRSGGDGSRKRSHSRTHEVHSRGGGTPPPGSMRHLLKAPRWLTTPRTRAALILSSVVLERRVCLPAIQRTLKVIVRPPHPCATAPAAWRYSPQSACARADRRYR